LKVMLLLVVVFVAISSLVNGQGTLVFEDDFNTFNFFNLAT